MKVYIHVTARLGLHPEKNGIRLGPMRENFKSTFFDNWHTLTHDVPLIQEITWPSRPMNTTELRESRLLCHEGGQFDRRNRRHCHGKNICVTSTYSHLSVLSVAQTLKHLDDGF